MRTILLFSIAAGIAFGQNSVLIQVDAAQSVGPYKPIYGYFGYDEPNYTYADNGRKLIWELAALSSSPVYIRTHFMLATGDGTPGLKWGSTNAYTEDAAGKPIYNWTITDRIFDTYLKAGAKPFVEISFMPQALSSKPDPYKPEWIPGGRNDQYYIGWTYPPKDYAKWGELVYQWVSHVAQKYGNAEASSWYWEVWNEPDIAYWHGTPEEYDKLYDAAALAVKKVLPQAKVGGPASTGPAGQKAGDFLRQFLDHCDKSGVPLDFITYHAKGRPSVVEGHVRMGIAKNTEDVDKGFEIISSFPKFRGLPIVLSESDPEGCAACSARLYPQNAYRNGPLYASYEASMMKHIFELADARKTNIAGMLTWAFEFEGQPWFDGLRTLATNGVDKPVLNLFRMAGTMRGDRVKVNSAAALPLNAIEHDGVRAQPDIDAFAVRGAHDVSVLAWNYHDDDLPAQGADVKFQIAGLATSGRALLHEYAIDELHSNAWTAWKKMGSPQKPSAEQYAALEAAGQLQEARSPRWVDVKNGSVTVDAQLARQAVYLLRLEW